MSQKSENDAENSNKPKQNAEEMPLSGCVYVIWGRRRVKREKSHANRNLHSVQTCIWLHCVRVRTMTYLVQWLESDQFCYFSLKTLSINTKQTRKLQLEKQN